MSETFLTDALAKSKTSLKIARCFAFGGPLFPLDASFALSTLLKDAVEGRALSLKGDGTAVRSYMDARDLAIWLWRILLSTDRGSIYNVGSDQEVSILNLAREIAIMVGTDPREVRTERKAIAGLAPGRYVPSIEKANLELGLGLTIDRPAMLYRTLQFHRELTLLKSEKH